ncbi:MAG: hypothetical protein CBE23_003355 [Candidatus Pelagibacter sp. TMED263]|nr:MAG: hypothetical protein CBE23_003355 [Candidatus Pelagibacter sp. TMED263]|tara:strand:+ start:681 stop:1937 length:1257 start_codon:yes stop_codon:yes gene_type:complete
MIFKKVLIFLLWLLSIIFVIIWTYENPEKIEKIKSSFKKEQTVKVSLPSENSKKVIANSFELTVKKVLEVKDKTAFILYNSQSNDFDAKKLEIYTQSGSLIKNLKSEKLNLPKYFTLQRNGGVKTIITLKNKKIALISSNEEECYFASLILIEDQRELFKSKCLPEIAKNNDFNGLGSSNVHYQNKILFSLGTPEKHASKNSMLAQDDLSKFGKILEIDKTDLNKAIINKTTINPKIFSKGHRVPQGLTILDNKIFSVEHGPKGGDELNLLIKGKNYGWPNVSYGTNYLKTNGGDGSAYKINHNKEGFIEPLFAFVPSVGISSLNNCPSVLNSYYKKPCLMALSLYGNELRKGYSMIIFLLNDEMNKVNSIEKISLEDLVLRHFVTNGENKLFEDEKGNIYISADKKGIYRITFSKFR